MNLTRSYLLKGKIAKAIYALSIVFILFASHINAAQPMYGAYPASLHPANVKKLIDRVVAKYRTCKLDFSPLSKKMIINGLIEADKSIPGKNYGQLAECLKNKDVTKEDPKLTTIQFDQVTLCNEILGLSKSMEKVEITKELSTNISKQSQVYKDEAFQIVKTIQNKSATDYLEIGMYIFNSTWGINRPIGMMWLDASRVPVMRLFLELASCLNKKGQFVHAENDAIADAAFILAATQIYRLTSEMALPMPFVQSKQYTEDLSYQQNLLRNIELRPNRAQSVEKMRKAAEAQLKNVFTGSAGDALDADRSWYRGAFYAGMTAAWRSTNDEWYLKQAEALAQRTKCMPGPNAHNDANDLAIAQTYLELYEQDSMYADYRLTQICLDSLIQKYNPNKVEWSWCDALFMSPPTWARMGKITKDQKYFQHMDKLWWQTTGLLYDKNEHLFYRDLTYTRPDDGFQIKERNGEKIFWGRGNGWVIGALCRVLDYLPENFPSRPKYESMFKEMCNKLLSLQGEDGLWRASLLDPKSYPMGETSSSTFYCYAFAWGINHKILDPKRFSPAAEKAWKALCACIDDKTGRLEFVQLPADSPRSPVYKHCNVEYATGAFLLAGAEILKLVP